MHSLLPDAAAGPSSLEPREVINFLWRQWRLIASAVALGVLIAVLYLVTAVPLYVASTQLMLDPRRERAAGSDAFVSEAALDQSMIESQIALIRSTVFLRRVAEKERLLSNPDYKAKATNSGEQQGRQTAMQRDAVPPELIGAIEGIKGAIGVGRIGSSYLLNVSVTSPDPIRAARLANTVAESFVLDKLEARYESAQRASAWLSDRLAELRGRMRESDEAIKRYKAENNLLLSSATVTLNQSQLTELNQKLVAARTDLAEKKARLDLITSAPRRGNDVQALLPEMVNSQIVVSLRAQLSALTQKEADLSARYTSGHPQIISVRSERHDIERALATEIQKLTTNLQSEYELAKSKADSLEKTVREVTGQSDTDNSAVLGLRELEKTAAIDRTLFEDFLQKAKITQEQSTFETREARVLTPALVPGAPSFPVRNRALVLGVLIGLSIGVAAAVLKERLNAGYTTANQVEAMLDLPVLASVTRMEDRNLMVAGKLVPVHEYPALMPLSRFSEAIRSIRSGVQMTDVDHQPKVIQLTSSVPAEGKTTLAICLAQSAALSGMKVLLIDGDLRRPSISKLLGFKQDAGLVDLLVGTASAQDVIKNVAGRFWVLPTGSKTQNPTDLLESDRMKSLLESFRQAFDYIIIDSAPCGPVNDPVVVSNLVDKVVYVVRWGSTHRDLVQQCVQKFAGHKRIAGIVFNSVIEREAKKYGKYGYAYYYGGRYYNKYYQG